ncbi:MAG: hypothetical protein MRQ07_00395 [Candidatus Midichloria sp.]|nr:hypothetical protein [Candidatus Midichloria sp.]
MARTGGSKKNLEIPSDAAIELEIYAIVGARNASINGLKIAEELASNLSSAGYSTRN